jgi:hypothetical protein
MGFIALLGSSGLGHVITYTTREAVWVFEGD